ncbi:MAG: hypothetical protein WCV90_04010 [Candidatus Woesearchaeota archaeon]|jgi:hypothetical protein
MVYYKELVSRVKGYYKFDSQELLGLAAVALVGGFVYSFRDWGGETFDPTSGFRNLALTILVFAFSVWFRLSCQKVYGLAEGHQARFKVWWVGLGISLILAFITIGNVPLILAGGMSVAFMVKLRLGEFRYGFSYWTNAMIGMWGVIANLILGIIFAIGLYLSPENYLYSQGLVLNIIMAWCSLIPLPQLDGLNIFFGSRILYYIALFITLLGTVLLLTKTTWGLILAIVIGLIAGAVYALIGSER